MSRSRAELKLIIIFNIFLLFDSFKLDRQNKTNGVSYSSSGNTIKTVK